MLRAVIFDFNGVLVDDEPIHLAMFQRALREEGIILSEQDYYESYLGMDDRGCFDAAFKAHGRNLDESRLAELIRRKAVYYRDSIEKKTAVFPGAEKLISDLSGRYPLAIASGALRSEIEMALESIGLKKYFQVIVSAEDVNQGKPNPEIFVKALHGLNQKKLGGRSIVASECLVVEDSKEGILGARRAGMKCLAVANSYPAGKLSEADAVVKSLEEVSPPLLESLFS